jgi:hypothetical protein
VPPLDLQRSRDLGALFETAFPVWLRHFPVFFALAFIVVAPVMALVDGAWAGTLDEFTPEDGGPWEAQVVSWLCLAIVVPALVTAMHVVVVQDLGRGVTPTLRHSLAVALRVAVPVAIAMVLYTLGMLALGLLLILPGIWIAVRWYFAPQAVVVEGRRGGDALSRSGELVDGMWWRVFGIALLVMLLTTLFGVPLALVGVAVEAAGADTGLVVAAFQIAWNSVGMSFTALVATLLFFDLRVRTDPPITPAAGPAARARPAG